MAHLVDVSVQGEGVWLGLGDFQSAADEASVVGPVDFGRCVFHAVLSLTH